MINKNEFTGTSWEDYQKLFDTEIKLSNLMIGDNLKNFYERISLSSEAGTFGVLCSSINNLLANIESIEDTQRNIFINCLQNFDAISKYFNYSEEDIKIIQKGIVNNIQEIIDNLMLIEFVDQEISISKSDLIRNVKAFMEKLSYFDLETDDEDSELIYTTRENGDGLNEIPGKEDIEHALLMLNKLRLEFGDLIIVSYEEVDEWTYINIAIN